MHCCHGAGLVSLCFRKNELYCRRSLVVSARVWPTTFLTWWFSFTWSTRAAFRVRLGVRLVNRTTRTMALTDEGAAFHARCVRILAEIDEAETEVTRGRDKAVGLLKITSTFAFGRRHLATLMHEFQKGHPDVQIHLEASDSIVSLVDGGFDLAIRFGPLLDSSLIARVLAPDHRVICGAPTYLEQRGRPQMIEDLLSHDCIIYGSPLLDHWTFVDGSSVRLRGGLITNDGDLAHVWV